MHNTMDRRCTVTYMWARQPFPSNEYLFFYILNKSNKDCYVRCPVKTSVHCFLVRPSLGSDSSVTPALFLYRCFKMVWQWQQTTEDFWCCWSRADVEGSFVSLSFPLSSADSLHHRRSFQVAMTSQPFELSYSFFLVRFLEKGYKKQVLVIL